MGFQGSDLTMTGRARIPQQQQRQQQFGSGGEELHRAALQTLTNLVGSSRLSQPWPRPRPSGPRLP
jgi:hypothetical protein